MSNEVTIEVKALPATLQRALDAVGYGRRDIEVEARETVRLNSAGGDGYKAFAAVVNLETGKYEIEWGSWGGPNMFVTNAVDSDRKDYPIPLNGAVIKGEKGGSRPVYASIYVHPSTLTPMLPARRELTDKQRLILGIVRGTKGGHYRRDAFARLGGVSEAEINALVSAELLKKNKAGSISITTAGCNEASRGY